MLVDQDGPIAVCVGAPFYRAFQVVRLNTQGNQLALTVSAAFSDRSADALLRDGSSGAYYIGGYACSVVQCKDAQYVMRLDAASLVPDPSYGASGVAQVLSLPIGDVLGMALDNSARIVLGGSYGASRPGYDGQVFTSGYLARLTGTGLLDPTFRAGGVVQGLPDSVIDVTTDVDSKVYALSATLLRRFNVDGDRDSRFASSANAQRIHEQIGLQVDQSRAAQAHRRVEPLERLRAIAPLRVDRGALVGGGIGCCSLDLSRASQRTILAVNKKVPHESPTARLDLRCWCCSSSYRPASGCAGPHRNSNGYKNDPARRAPCAHAVSLR